MPEPDDCAENTLRISRILALLRPLYPDLRPQLDYADPFQLLVATVLSAQCTDARVNQVTPALFARFPGPADLAAAPPEELEALIHSTGFFRAKARNLLGLARRLVAVHQGAVPADMRDLTQLPGVGRKTAGVVLSACFGGAALIVDTHFGRVCRRLGLSGSDDPAALERDLGRLLPPERWTEASHLLNRHGRAFCTARKPACAACPVRDLCPRQGV